MALYLPTALGRAALAELGEVDWGDLAHCYGTGRTGPHLHDDVAVCLRRLGDRDDDAIGDALYALYSNISHQGSVYEATAPAVPFLVAVAADPGLGANDVLQLVALVANIAIATADDNAIGEDAAAHARAALHACAPALRALAVTAPACAPILAAIVDLAAADAPDPDAVSALLDELLGEAAG